MSFGHILTFNERFFNKSGKVLYDTICKLERRRLRFVKIKNNDENNLLLRTSTANYDLAFIVLK